MSTRGVVGFRLEGQDYLAYNHSDSYPSWLGKEVVHKLSVYLYAGEAHLAELVRKIKIVDEDTPPPKDPEERERLKAWTNTRVSTPAEYWYQTLRETQGDIQAILESGYILDASTFIKDSLFCEWGYIVNLDECVLEVYEGYQKAKHNKGRYARRNSESEGFFPCALVMEFSFAQILESPDDVVSELIAFEESRHADVA